MFIVRSVFHAKPGKAKDLVNTFKKVKEYMPALGVYNTVIMTDVSASFWTVVIQSEVKDLNAYADMSTNASENPEIADAMKGYNELVSNGYREIYRIE